MKTVTITTLEQFKAVVRSWYASEVTEDLQAGHSIELTLKRRKDTKSRLQEEKYHAMLNDIAKQCRLFGKQLPPISWKRVLVDAFKHETKDDPQFRDHWARFGDIELVPALNHPGFVMVGEQTRSFNTTLAAGFIEWLLAYGAENGVQWTPSRAQRAQYEAMQR